MSDDQGLSEMTSDGEAAPQSQAESSPVARRDVVRRLGVSSALAAAGLVAFSSPAAAETLSRTQPRRFRLAPPPVGEDTPASAIVNKGYVDERIASLGVDQHVMRTNSDQTLTGRLTASGTIQGLAGGVAYHNPDLRSGQVAADLIVTFPGHSRTTTGDFGTFLCTWSNRAGHSVYILNCFKQWGAAATVTLTKLAGNRNASFSYQTRTVDSTSIRLVLGVSNGTHQSSSASFTAQLIGDSRGRGAATTWVRVSR